MNNTKLVYSIFLSLLFFSFLFIKISKVIALDNFETFNLFLTNPGFWQSIRGPISYNTETTHQFASLVTPNGVNPFQYLKSVDFTTILPNYDNIQITAKFSTNSINQGAGYIFSDNVPTEGSALQFSNYMFYIWPKPDGSFHIFSSICPATNPICDVGSQLANGIFSFPVDNLWHEIELKRVSGHYEWYLDSNLVFTSVDTIRVVSSVGIGDPENTSGFLIWPILNIDYIGISSNTPPPSPSPSPTVIPSSSPSPSPTLSPSPSPTAAPAFPYLSQLDPAWANEEYDKASTWAGLDKYGIGRWGCALTSAAMVLQHHGVKAHDGTDIDPSKLNAWLKSQGDGYVGYGYLNWLALTRYVRQSYDLGHSPTKLEYKRSYLPTIPSLPAILSLPGHFVVAYAGDDLSWDIHDPADIARTSLPKTATINSISNLVPSLTDLSYMMFVADPELHISLLDHRNRVVPIDWSYEYITDDIDATSSPTTRVGIVPKLPKGKYDIRVNNSSDDKHFLEIYLYDKRGETYIRKLKIGEDSDLKFELKYDNNKVGKSKLEHNKRYRYQWNHRRKWWDKIWDEHDRWEERKSDDHDKRKDD